MAPVGIRPLSGRDARAVVDLRVERDLAEVWIVVEGELLVWTYTSISPLLVTTPLIV